MRTLEELLLELSLCDLNLDRLVHLLHVSALVVGIVLDSGREEGVDEGRLSEARLARHLRVLEFYTCCVLCPARTMIVKAAPRFATILCLLNVRHERCACAPAENIPLVGQLRCSLASANRCKRCIHTLAMPIGDADSAIVSCVWRVRLWVVLLRWPVSGRCLRFQRAQLPVRRLQSETENARSASGYGRRGRVGGLGEVLSAAWWCCCTIWRSPFSARPPWAGASPDEGRRSQRRRTLY